MNRETAPFLQTVLHRLADRTVIGLLVLLGCLPILIAPAAIAAGARAVGTATLGEGVTTFWRTYRRAALRSIPFGTLSLALLGSGLCSMLLVAPSVQHLERGISTIVGLGVVAAAGLALALSAALLAAQEPVKLSSMGALLLVTPAAAIGVMVLQFLTAVALLTIPILALPIAGWVAATVAVLQRRIQQQPYRLLRLPATADRVRVRVRGRRPDAARGRQGRSGNLHEHR